MRDLTKTVDIFARISLFWCGFVMAKSGSIGVVPVVIFFVIAAALNSVAINRIREDAEDI